MILAASLTPYSLAGNTTNHDIPAKLAAISRSRRDIPIFASTRSVNSHSDQSLDAKTPTFYSRGPDASPVIRNTPFRHAPGGTRIPNLLIRSQMLYPIELQARKESIVQKQRRTCPTAETRPPSADKTSRTSPQRQANTRRTRPRSRQSTFASKFASRASRQRPSCSCRKIVSVYPILCTGSPPGGVTVKSM